jgi:hypothetical protein
MGDGRFFGLVGETGGHGCRTVGTSGGVVVPEFEAYAWLDDSDIGMCGCLTLVRGADLTTVAWAFGGDLDTAVETQVPIILEVRQPREIATGRWRRGSRSRRDNTRRPGIPELAGTSASRTAGPRGYGQTGRVDAVKARPEGGRGIVEGSLAGVMRGACRARGFRLPDVACRLGPGPRPPHVA